MCAWSGTYGHGAGHYLNITPDADRLEVLARYDPTGETIHYQEIDNWRDYYKGCPAGKHLTIYVGGVYKSPNHYDIHCSKW
jgi:hypothetical protein